MDSWRRTGKESRPVGEFEGNTRGDGVHDLMGGQGRSLLGGSGALSWEQKVAWGRFL